MGKINITNSLRCTAQRCGIKAPLKLSWDEIKDRLKICEKKCEHFSKHEREYQKNQHKQRLDVTRAKNNQEAERTILETIQRERELVMWKRLQNAILDHLSKPNNIQPEGAAMRPQSMHRNVLKLPMHHA
jgi:hypothetical protein